MAILMDKIKTIEKFKKDVFDELDDNKKLKYMYQMGKQLCEISDCIKYSKGMDFQKIEKIKKILGDVDE